MVQRGEAFELEIKLLLEAELNGGLLGINPSNARVFHRKRYHSPARNGNIIVDVSLEMYRSGASQPFLVWIWECKDYAHPVPVDDIEEFHSKLEQIGTSLTKGTVASRNGFQESAIEVARTWGIGLVRMQPDGSLVRLLESASYQDLSLVVRDGLLQPPGTILRSMFFGIGTHGHPADEFSDYVSAELNDIGSAG